MKNIIFTKFAQIRFEEIIPLRKLLPPVIIEPLI